MLVLLADDHALVREGLKPLIRRVADGVSIIDAENLGEAMEMAASAEDLRLAVLDLKMPGMNGFGGLELFRKRFPDVPVVILSGSLNRGDVLGAVKHGASGYIPKTVGGETLINALRLVLSGEKHFPSFVFSSAGNDNTGSNAAPEDPFESLNEREAEVLRLVIEGLSNKEIARQLDVQEITVKKRLSGVFRKLEVSNRTQATKLALQLNWGS